jgi:hypothetical protein
MICPVCLNEYTLLDFDVEPDTLEHRGLFSCECSDPILFPETVTREMMTDEDLRERLRLSRLLYLRHSLDLHQPSLQPSAPRSLRLNTNHLQRYLEDVSQISLRQLK